MSPQFFQIPLRKMFLGGFVDTQDTLGIHAYLFSPIVVVGEDSYIFQSLAEELGQVKHDPHTDDFRESRINISFALQMWFEDLADITQSLRIYCSFTHSLLDPHQTGSLTMVSGWGVESHLYCIRIPFISNDGKPNPNWPKQKDKLLIHISEKSRGGVLYINCWWMIAHLNT